MYLGQVDIIESETNYGFPDNFNFGKIPTDKELKDMGILKISNKEEEKEEAKTIKTAKIKETLKSYAPYILGGVALYYIFRKK